MEVQQLVTAFLSKNFEKCDVLYSFKTSKITFEQKKQSSGHWMVSMAESGKK